MRALFQCVFCVFLAGWGQTALAAPLRAEYDLVIDNCVIFDTGVPYVFADDCTGTITVETDSDITFDTPDVDQTGHAILRIISPTYGETGALFFNFIEEYIPDDDGVLVPICLSFCFHTDVNEDGELSFTWGAFRGLPYSFGQFIEGSGIFDFDDSFFRSDGVRHRVIAEGDIVPVAVPLPSSVLLLLAGLTGLWMRRQV